MLTLEKRNELIIEILRQLQTDDGQVTDDISQMVPVDWALALESTPASLRQQMWQLLPEHLRLETLSTMREETRNELLKTLEQQQLIEVTQYATSEQAVNVISNLSSNNASAVITGIENNEHSNDSSAIKAAMEYAADLVGRHAERDYFTLSAVMTVAEAKIVLNENDAHKIHHYIFLTDTRGKLVGKVKTISLWHQSDTDTLATLTQASEEFICDSEKISNLGTIFKRFDVDQLPVVDVEGRMIGTFNAHDVISHLENYYESELAHAGNVNDEDLFAPVISSAKQRAVWLGINLMTAILAAQVIGMFENTLNTLVALAVLMPIVASMGGIAGSQTLTLTIRGLATNQLSDVNISLLRNKEFKVALINSVLWAVTVALIAYFWFSNVKLAIILGLAVTVNMVITVLFGIAIPYTMHKMKIDPALAGSVVLTTVSDVVGFFVFLGLATIWLL